MITIDGSKGEGGGQVLRTALALAMITGQPFRIDNIRARRKKPGLLRQHLTAVQAATCISNAQTEGAEMGSTRLSFVPSQVIPGEYRFAVGTAGSSTLVLQTVLPPLLTAKQPSSVIVEGGTHNSMAPSFHFLEKTFLPLVNRMGPKVEALLERPGFYPAGGGRIRVLIQPVEALQPIHVLERGKILQKHALILHCHLPKEIAQRQERMLRNRLNWKREWITVERIKDGAGPGNVAMVEITSEHLTELFTGFGERNVPSGRVIGGLVEKVLEYLQHDAPVGEHLADQLMLPFAMAGGGSYRAIKETLHAVTNRSVIETFLDVAIHSADLPNGSVEFSLAPSKR